MVYLADKLDEIYEIGVSRLNTLNSKSLNGWVEKIFSAGFEPWFEDEFNNISPFNIFGAVVEAVSKSKLNFKEKISLTSNLNKAVGNFYGKYSQKSSKDEYVLIQAKKTIERIQLER